MALEGRYKPALQVFEWSDKVALGRELLVRKLKAGAVAKSVAKRVIHPGHLMRAVKLQRGRKRTKVAFADAELPRHSLA